MTGRAPIELRHTLSTEKQIQKMRQYTMRSKAEMNRHEAHLPVKKKVKL